MKYRHEIKFIINKNQAEILKQRLGIFMQVDKNSKNKDNTYFIRSLYFDDLRSSAYYEKLDGVLYRKKYRIRIYNFDDSFIRLECKYKHNNMTSKKQVKINKEVYKRFIEGDVYNIKTANQLMNQFMLDMKMNNLKPSIIVDYNRLAYTYHISDVRITFDSKIKTGAFNYDLFDNNYASTSVIEDEEVVLEVKYNEILPEHIANILSTVSMFRQAYSKFAMCRSIK